MGKVFWIVLVSIILLVAIGCTVIIIGTRSSVSYKKIVDNPQEALADCAKKDSSSRDMCYLQISQGVNDLNIGLQACERIVNGGYKDDCHMNLLSLTKELTYETGDKFCKNVTDKQKRNNCYEYLVRDGGILDPRLCNQITSVTNKQACQYVITDNAVDMVLEDTDKAMELCGQLDGEARSGCIRKSVNLLIVENADRAINACGLVKEASTKESDNCFSEIGYQLAGTEPKRAMDACIKMVDVITRDNCVSNWFRVTDYVKSDFDYSMYLCKYVANEDNCYRQIADVYKDISKSKAKRACDSISSKSGRESCGYTIGQEEENRIG